MPDELRGWKDIGAYLGTSERTAQRWEHVYGMPVRRAGRTRGASVFALPDELDSWRLSPAGVRATADEPAAPDAPPPAEEPPAGPPPARRHVSRRVVAGIAALGFIVVVSGGVWLSRSFRHQAAPAPQASKTRPYAQAFTTPVSPTPAVFLLEITSADGLPFTVHVADGTMTTIAIRGGTKLGFSPLENAHGATFDVYEIVTLPSGGESVRSLTTQPLTRRSAFHVDHGGIRLDVAWLGTVSASALPVRPLDAPPAQCCIFCGGLMVCAAEVVAPCGNCCGFAGCRKPK